MITDEQVRDALRHLDPEPNALLPQPATQARVLASFTGDAPTPRRRRRRRRPWPVLFGGLAIAASSAIAAVALHTGEPAGRSWGIGSPIEGPGLPVHRTVQLLGVRAADPDGGPPWGLRVFKTGRGAACYQVGRIYGGQLGWLGQDGVSGNDGLLHPLALSGDQCRPLDGAGNLYAVQEWSALASGSIVQPAACQVFRGERPGFAMCPRADLRFVRFGFLGPRLRTITIKGGGSLPVADGAFLEVRRMPDPFHAPAMLPLTAVFAGGRTWPVTDVVPLEEAYGVGPTGPLPPGYVTPLRQLPSPSRLRAPVTVREQRWGRNTIYAVSFTAPVSTRRYRVNYRLLLDGSANTAGRRCAGPLRFGGYERDRDVRAGTRITIPVSPAITLRWNRGWCPGTYRGRIVLHDRAHTVGTFEVSVPPRPDGDRD